MCKQQSILFTQFGLNPTVLRRKVWADHDLWWSHCAWNTPWGEVFVVILPTSRKRFHFAANEKGARALKSYFAKILICTFSFHSSSLSSPICNIWNVKYTIFSFSPAQVCRYCTADRKHCDTEEPRVKSEGITDADFVFYISATQTERCNKGATVAYAAHCQQESAMDRWVFVYTITFWHSTLRRSFFLKSVMSLMTSSLSKWTFCILHWISLFTFRSRAISRLDVVTHGFSSVDIYISYCYFITSLTSMFCILFFTDRPIAGHANLCPDSISTKPQDLETLLSTVKHEILHALGFSLSLYAYFRDSQGKPLTPRGSSGKPLVKDARGTYWGENVITRVIRHSWKVRSGLIKKEIHVISTPRVVVGKINFCTCNFSSLFTQLAITCLSLFSSPFATARNNNSKRCAITSIVPTWREPNSRTREKMEPF